MNTLNNYLSALKSLTDLRTLRSLNLSREPPAPDPRWNGVPVHRYIFKQTITFSILFVIHLASFFSWRDFILMSPIPPPGPVFGG